MASVKNKKTLGFRVTSTGIILLLSAVFVSLVVDLSLYNVNSYNEKDWQFFLTRVNGWIFIIGIIAFVVGIIIRWQEKLDIRNREKHHKK